MGGGGEWLKNKNLGPSSKLNQLVYTSSVGPRKTKNAKTNNPKGGGGEVIYPPK